MITNLKGRDFISTQDWDIQELKTLLELAKDYKLKHATGIATPHLLYKTLYMLFFFSSTRTRTSFETAMTQLGGHSIFLDPKKTQLSHGESIKDTSKVLSAYGEAIAIRHCDYNYGNGYLRQMAEHSSVPIINMQCDVYHPCQIMADYLTIMEEFGNNTRGLKIGVAWTSAPNYIRPLSVPQSLILLMPRFGLDVTLARPKEFKLMPDIVEQAKQNAKLAGTKFEISENFEDAFEDADIVIPKSWGPLVTADNEKEGLAMIDKYKGWVCDDKTMSLTNKDSIYMHPLPADRGQEVTESVIDGKHSRVYIEAENRLHVQKALLSLVMGGRL